MAMKDITDKQVCEAYLAARLDSERYPYDYLMQITGQPFKVCLKCMERACYRGYVEYGVSLRTGWLTDEGFHLAGVEPFRWSEGMDFKPIPWPSSGNAKMDEEVFHPHFENVMKRMAEDFEQVFLGGTEK
ncbi:hypothetical protein EVC24_005 [Rhizobium phage RHph_I4]|nr:hypothetical protein EVC24_005 [Rhizobium phage RHph_I4]